ncbi:DUF4910 domain-containing protein [Aurantivibrio plasticivorans]
MYSWAQKLFPICRSITGQGVRDTLTFINEILPEMEIKSVPSGYRAFDWVVPLEWNIRSAYVEDESGERIIDFAKSNLHVVGYSIPVDKWVSRDELDEHLYSLPDQPDAIPYVTSYYNERWGFCVAHNERIKIKGERFRVVIDSSLESGELNYGELILTGESSEEVFLSTYVCHPSLANNELSGPVVATCLAKLLKEQKSLRYSYRIVFIPETIGSLVYISKNYEQLKSKVVAGFNLTCLGDDNCYSFLPSRKGDTLADKTARHVLSHIDSQFKSYSWLDRGSDERQYCAPGIDLPVTTIMRSKYGEYEEYHTSLDNLDYISANGLGGGAEALIKAIEVIENNRTLIATCIGEPQLGKRGLYPDLSIKNSSQYVRQMLNVISLADGREVLSIAESLGVPLWDLYEQLNLLVASGIVKYGEC